MTRDVVRIVSVLPALLSTYGDRGNVVVLERRLAWRGIDVDVIATGVSDPLPADGDLYVLGGAEDGAQAAALELLRGSALSVLVDRGVPVFAVCAGLQLLGTTLTGSDGRTVAGLDILDVSTHHMPERALGETITRPDPGLGLPLLNGFSNHSGATVLGDAARPLAEVVHGPGNAGNDDAYEGVLMGSVVGTYLHGPVLARNPALADLLLSRAIGGRLAALPPGPEEQLRDERVAAAASRHPGGRRTAGRRSR